MLKHVKGILSLSLVITFKFVFYLNKIHMVCIRFVQLQIHPQGKRAFNPIPRNPRSQLILRRGGGGGG